MWRMIKQHCTLITQPQSQMHTWVQDEPPVDRQRPSPHPGRSVRRLRPEPWPPLSGPGASAQAVYLHRIPARGTQQAAHTCRPHLWSAVQIHSAVL